MVTPPLYPGQPVPVLDHLFGEGLFRNTQPTPPLEVDSSCSFSSYLEEEKDPTCLQTPTLKSTLKVAGFRIPFDISWISAMQKELGLGVTDQAVHMVR